jgi:ribosome-binding ATPase YchF (GTP1/OBG family)
MINIAVFGIDFPLGKKSLNDERLIRLKDIFHVPKVTQIQIDFQDSTHLNDASGILCEKNAKLDLILQDLEIIENRLSTAEQNQDLSRSYAQERDLLLRSKEALEKETLLNELNFNIDEQKILLNFNLATLKPLTFVDKENLPSYPEITQQVYSDNGMISFFTVNERELRAWGIKSGTTVYEAAGVIHTDIQRGFIKAEVINYKDLIKVGSLNQAKAQALVKLEGKEYIVKDGDLIQIRFNV